MREGRRKVCLLNGGLVTPLPAVEGEGGRGNREWQEKGGKEQGGREREEGQDGGVGREGSWNRAADWLRPALGVFQARSKPWTQDSTPRTRP